MQKLARQTAVEIFTAFEGYNETFRAITRRAYRRFVDRAWQHGLDREVACLLIHSGSRGLGQAILRDLLEEHGANPLEEGSDAALRR